MKQQIVRPNHFKVAVAALMVLVLMAAPSEQQQMKSCPSKSGNCSTKLAPLTCGPDCCRYDNSCRAELNGYHAKKDCRPVSLRKPTKNPGVMAPPRPSHCTHLESPCEGDSGIYLCGHYLCQYLNSCLAELNGFNLSTECTRVNF
jgi:hypothetical protein